MLLTLTYKISFLVHFSYIKIKNTGDFPYKKFRTNFARFN
jgi:hypothetical protein